MGLKGYLYRKIQEKRNESKAKNLAEATIRKQEYQKNYGGLYAKEYRKALEQQIKQKFKEEKGGSSGFRGKLKGGIKRGFLQPDHAGISNALYGIHPLLAPQPVRMARKIKQKSTDLSDLL
jgi:hypothetical protein